MDASLKKERNAVQPLTNQVHDVDTCRVVWMYFKRTQINGFFSDSLIKNCDGNIIFYNLYIWAIEPHVSKHIGKFGLMVYNCKVSGSKYVYILGLWSVRIRFVSPHSQSGSLALIADWAPSQSYVNINFPFSENLKSHGECFGRSLCMLGQSCLLVA